MRKGRATFLHARGETNIMSTINLFFILLFYFIYFYFIYFYVICERSSTL